MLSGPCEILPWGPMNPQIFKNLYLFPWKDLQNVFWSKSLSMGSLKIHMERALDPCKYLPRALLFLAATKQLCKWYFPSVRLSVTPFWLCSHHRIIVKFITNDQSKVHAKGQGQRSRWQRSQPNLIVSGLKLQFEFTYDDEMMHIAWCCLEEVPYCFSRSSVKFQGHTALKIVEFDLDWAFPDCNSSLNSPMATKLCTKLEVA